MGEGRLSSDRGRTGGREMSEVEEGEGKIGRWFGGESATPSKMLSRRFRWVGHPGTAILRSDPKLKRTLNRDADDNGGLPPFRARSERGEGKGRNVPLSKQNANCSSHVASRFHCRFHENGTDAANHWVLTS